MTVVQPNSIAGINSISVQSGQSLSIHKSDGTLIREIVASTGISTYSSISVGSATTTNNANKSINIGLGASIAQHADNTLSFGTNGDERVRIDATGQFNIGVAATIFANGNATFAGIVTTARLGNTYVTSQLGIGGAAADYQNLHIHDADPRIRIQSSGTNAAKIQFADSGSGDVGVIEYSHSDNSMRFNTNSGERVRIDSSGRVLVGTSAGRSAAGVTAQLQVEGTSYDTASLNLIINANSNQPPYLSLAKTRGTSDGSSTIVQANDYLGIIQFCGADGTDIESRGAEIYAQVDGSPGSNDMPGRLVFKTTADGAASPTERLRIASTGQVGLGTATVSGYNDRMLTLYNASTCYLEVRTNAGDNNSGIIFSKGSAQDSDSYRGYIAYNHSTDRMTFHTGGGTRRGMFDANGLHFDTNNNSAETGLDDYEEGYWSPTAVDGMTLHLQNANNVAARKYVKIGRLVTCWFDINWDSGNSSANFRTRFGGLPFSKEATSEGAGGALTVSYFDGSETVMNAHTDGSNLLGFYKNGNDMWSYSNSAGDRIAGSFTYVASA